MPEDNSHRRPVPAPSPPPPHPDPENPAGNAPETDPKKLTPEEQMALFEKDLKEKDWGHQPC